jgi:hypothetical protein
MGKYEPLANYLRSQRLSEVPMTFAEVEQVLGVPLPPSAYKHRPWWANEASGNHVHARVWLNAGFRAEQVALDDEKVVFVRTREPMSRPAKDNGFLGRVTPMPNVERHPLLGSMKGMIRPAPDVDFTEPADPDWGERA